MNDQKDTQMKSQIYKDSKTNTPKVDKGQISVLKLKKQIMDLNQIVKMKQIEIDDMIKVFK